MATQPTRLDINSPFKVQGSKFKVGNPELGTWNAEHF